VSQAAAIGAGGADSPVATYLTQVLDSTFAWRDLEWIRSITKLPIVIKGVLRADDAVRAVEYGVDAIAVSNHGGRQLDTAVATIDALGPIAEAVEGRVELFVDGGVRRGTDVLKALALGARAVLLGRPVLWGLAVGGEKGVRNVLDLLTTEIHHALALCGCPRISDVSRDLIVLG
jgi:4-hydroxymandelate oxidase